MDKNKINYFGKPLSVVIKLLLLRCVGEGKVRKVESEIFFLHIFLKIRLLNIPTLKDEKRHELPIEYLDSRPKSG